MNPGNPLVTPHGVRVVVRSLPGGGLFAVGVDVEVLMLGAGPLRAYLEYMKGPSVFEPALPFGVNGLDVGVTRQELGPQVPLTFEMPRVTGFRHPVNGSLALVFVFSDPGPDAEGLYWNLSVRRPHSIEF